MALRHSDRIRRRASEVQVAADSNGVHVEKVATTMVVQGDKSGKRFLRDRRDIELMMECEDDALTPSQIKANHEAKEAHSLAMRQIRAAHEGRLSFVRGTPVIHDRPIIVQTLPQNSVSPARAVQSQQRQQVTVAFPSAANKQFMSPAHATAAKTRFMPQPMVSQSNSSQQFTYILGPSKQTVPMGRDPAQPRKQVYPATVNEVISGTCGLGVKRNFPPYESPRESEATFKRQKKARTEQMDSHGNWVSLDDYYYGKMESNVCYMEESGEYRFKCWYCNKMLYNNIKAMMHLQSHIDSEKQHNLDLSDLTQCKHCYKQFDTPFEMQTHIERVHLSNSNVLLCRICEKDHDTHNALATHMKQNHGSCEMPYICQLCSFRSSMYGDVVDHFKKKHDNSPNLLCLYCLKVYKIKFVANGWGITQNFYHHLVKHQSKNRCKKCPCCKLSFISPNEMKTHKKNDHTPNSRTMCMTLNSKGQEPVMIKVPQGNSGGVKSLNAPAVIKNLDLGRLRIPTYASNFHCYECKGSMSNPSHFKKYTLCSMCRYATSCSSAYANHMMSFHSGRALLNVFLTVPQARPMETRRYCLCGFSSVYGNKIANHMVFCYKRTCYSKKPEPQKEVELEEQEMDPRRRPGASILDALGLVKKQTAKRSSDMDNSATTTALLSQFEKETFVGVTNLSIAQVLSDSNKDDASLDSDDYDVEEEIPSDDDNDDDYRPGRFRNSPHKLRTSRRGTMYVKMGFDKLRNKKPKLELKPEPKREASFSRMLPGVTPGRAGDAENGTSQKDDKASSSPSLQANISLSEESKESSQSEEVKSIDAVESENVNEGKAGSCTEVEQKEVTDKTNTLDIATTSLDIDSEPSTGEKSVNSEETTSKPESETSQDSIDKKDNSVVDRVSEGDNSCDKNISDEMECEEPVEMTSNQDSDEQMALIPDKSESNTPEANTPEAESNKDSNSSSVEAQDEMPNENQPEKDITMVTDTGNTAEGESHVTEVDDDDEEAAEEQVDEAIKDDPDDSRISGDGEVVEGEAGRVSPESCHDDEVEHYKEEETLEKQQAEDIPEADKTTEEQEIADNKETTENEETNESAEIAESENIGDSKSMAESEETSESPQACETQETEDVEDTTENTPQEEDMDTSSVTDDVTIATEETEEQLIKGDKSEVNQGSDASQDIPEETESVQSTAPESQSEIPPSAAEAPPPQDELPIAPSKEGPDNQNMQIAGSAEKRSSSGDNVIEDLKRDSYESDHRHQSRSSHDKSDRRHSSSGSYHRDRSHDSGYHSNRHDRDRDDKYRDRSSGRYDDRGYSSRDYGRHGDRGYGGRDHDSHSNRDRHHDRDNRYHDHRHHDNRHQDRGYRKDSQGQGSWQGRSSGGSGYHGNHRRDYY